MNLTLDEVLALAGRLDDSPGFDAPRERFRRFLLDHVTDTRIARAFIAECQHGVGQQHRRALQDLVILLGRFLGFQTVFGMYGPSPDGMQRDGYWRSRPRLHILVRVSADRSAVADVDRMQQSLDGFPQSMLNASGAMMLHVLSPTYGDALPLQQAIAAAKPMVPIGIVSLASLLTLVDIVAAGRLDHSDVVRLFVSNPMLDVVIELLDRFDGGGSADREQSSTALRRTRGDAACWIATINPDYSTAPEQFVELVIGKRHVFGVSDAATARKVEARPGDAICFYIAGKGVVARADVAATGENGTGIRDARRFSQLLHLRNVEVYLSRPVALDFETELRLRGSGGMGSDKPQVLVRIPRESFAVLTAGRKDAAIPERPADTVPAAGAAMDRDPEKTPSARDPIEEASGMQNDGREPDESREPDRATISAEDSRSHE